MHSSVKKLKIRAIKNDVFIQRNSNGVPTISASNREDLCFGIGYAHAWDRMVQLMLVRAIGQGRASEKFAGSDELIAVDKFMRWIHFEKDIDLEIAKLDPDVKKELEAYCQGVNTVLSKKRRPLEFLMVGYRPESWEIKDCLITIRIMGYIGLAQAQGDMEKFLIQMIQNGVDENRIKSLFPYLTEKIDYDLIKQIKLINEIVPSHLWQGVLPNLRASNNWVISGKRTKSGQPILASDPHMEVNRLPALWYEMIWKLNDQNMMGITMPGVPAIVMGRTNDFAWGGTYGFMDMIDNFIEDCKDEKFLYDGKWLPFEKRIETITPKNKEPITLAFYENHHGALEGDPKEPGKYLSMAFTGRSGAGAEIFNVMMRIDEIRTVKEAQEKFRQLSMPTFNWVFADRDGNIGYQMNGRMPKRCKGLSGLLPIPGWESKNDWQGFVDPKDLPTDYNPDAGFFATANQDMNEFGKAKPINLPMGAYRAQQIIELLQQNDHVDVEYIKQMHYDLHSKQAERLMPLFLKFLPDTETGRILKEWDLKYDISSKGAMLFESVYLNLIKIVFGKHGIGEQAMDYLITQTGIFTDYYANFDDVLMDANSAWFSDKNRDAQIMEAIQKGLNVEVKPYGEVHKYDMLNIFLGGKLPGFFGFDVKDIPMPGSRATIPQGQIWIAAGRINTFAPSFRMIVELEKAGILSNIAGGPSGSGFSKFYQSDIKYWKQGIYKKLE
ncbi:penicillin acylase family protein [candidate division KSB1 bacterium]|nr:penicillin acylase family protein [candidate division KSB1 bacterium]